MEEEKRYYTPTIEEFHEGFEYEERDAAPKWNKRTYQTHEPLPEIEHEIKFERIRVPYLCKESIEELGWRYWKTGDEFTTNSIYFTIRTNEDSTSPNVYHLRFDPNNPGSLTITSWTDGSWGRNERTMHFYIKNKSELKKLMDFIGIRDWFVAKVKG